MLEDLPLIHKGINLDAIVQIYRQGQHLGWCVDKRDLVFIEKQGKKVSIGYNHSRAWKAARTPYSPYTNPEDFSILTDEAVAKIHEIVDGPPTIAETRPVEIKRA